MRLLYLHGLYSSPNPEKMAALSALGLQPTNPQIDYARKDVFSWLHEMALDIKPAYIVGSSMGGYVGYYLAKLLNTPALLFNPAFRFKNTAAPEVEKESMHNPQFHIVMGAHDDVVLPHETLSFLLEAPGNYEIWLEHEMGHQVPLPFFAKYAQRFMMAQKIYS